MVAESCLMIEMFPVPNVIESGITSDSSEIWSGLFVLFLKYLGIDNNATMFKRHLPLMTEEPPTASDPVLMKDAHKHHKAQLDLGTKSSTVRHLNLGKENKEKPFIQCSVSEGNLNAHVLSVNFVDK